MTSRSASIANADHAAIAVHRGARRVSYARAAAIPTAMCPTLAISYSTNRLRMFDPCTSRDKAAVSQDCRPTLVSRR
jgi:hypothetical protein